MRRLLPRLFGGLALVAPAMLLVGYFTLRGGGGDPDTLPIALVSTGSSGQFELTGALPPLPAEAEAFRLAGPDRDDVERLATAMGIDDEVVELGDGTFTAGGLQVSSFDGSGSWFFNAGGNVVGQIDGGGGVVVDCPPNARCVPPQTTVPPELTFPDSTVVPNGEAPAEADPNAVTAIEALLDASGWGGDATIGPLAPSLGVAAVSADPTLDGHPVSGLTFFAEIDANGDLLSASGYLGHPDSVGSFAIVSPDEAFDRLLHGVVASGGGPVPLLGGGIVGIGAGGGGFNGVAVAGGDATSGIVVEESGGTTITAVIGGAQPSDDPCPVEICGAPPETIPIEPPAVVSLVDAAEGYLLVSGLDGAAYLVPAVVFHDGSGIVYAVIAVAEEALSGATDGVIFDGGGRGVPVPLPAPAPAPPLTIIVEPATDTTFATEN